MSRRRSLPFWRALIMGLLLPAVLGIGTAMAASRDRTAPSAPANLRVTGVTPYTIGLAWDAARDNIGVVSYRVCCANVGSQDVAAPITSMAFGAGVEANRTFTLSVYAMDAAGNISKPSRSVTVTTPRDTTPPTTPTVSVTDVGPTHVSLAWSTVEDGPNVWFTVTRDGVPILIADRRTAAVIGLLAPETTYTFTVQARDFGGNSSPVSDPVVVTTEARDPTDTTPPSMPGNLHTFLEAPDGETWLDWTQSTDDRTPQEVITYEVFVNGIFDSATMGFGRAIVYGTPLSQNTYTVIAVDESGNRSAPATIVVNNF